MNRQTVKALEELHAQLQQDASFTRSDRVLVEQLQDDIQGVLASAQKVSELGEHPVHGRLQEAIQRFEVSHPVLTGLMGRVVDLLSNTGI